MSTVFTFPGQGSQSIGMGRELADAFPASKAVFEEVDDALGQKLSQLMWEGDEAELMLTANAQPALMAVSMAAIRALEASGFVLTEKVNYVAGHSLGEYSALCAAGTFSISTTAKLLRIRGNAMQSAAPVGAGAMAAIIGLDAADVEGICKAAAHSGVCQIANDNGGGQLVISGSKESVEEAASAATEKGAKRAILLPVSAPFHSALMAPAAEAMKEALATAEISNPVVPVLPNVNPMPISDGTQIAQYLVEQVTGQVRWRETIEWLGANGVETLYEVGSGKVLTGLARRIDRSLAGKAINNAQDIETVLAAL